jgi:riboflavin kinase/FMN adenylyltransferase
MVETHILDFDGNLYGNTLSTELPERLRSAERFESLDALVTQMEIDKARARAVLGHEEPSPR